MIPPSGTDNQMPEFEQDSRSSSTPESRLRGVRDRIESACRSAGRTPAEVELLAVSKTRGAEQLRTLADLGQRAFGENYVDESRAKQDRLDDLGLSWHFIGPIQSNKTRALAGHFDWVESVDRSKIVRRLGDQRPESLPPLNVLIQVDIDNESQKAGCSPDRIAALADEIAGRDRLLLRGLMAIPAAVDDPDDARPAFARLRRLFEQIAADHPTVDTLSMGMSGDLEPAIAEGSTRVRVGTALFGPRD